MYVCVCACAYARACVCACVCKCVEEWGKARHKKVKDLNEKILDLRMLIEYTISNAIVQCLRHSTSGDYFSGKGTGIRFRT